MILMLAILAQIVSAAPPVSPEEAVRILRASHSDRDRTDARSVPTDGPQVTVIGSGRTASGPWEWPAPLPAWRLDGRLWMDPELIYGQSWPWLPPGAYPAYVPWSVHPAYIPWSKPGRHHFRPRSTERPSAPPPASLPPPRHVTNGPPAMAGVRAR